MLLFSTGGLYWDLFIGLIGMGFIIYGRKKPDIPSLIAGIILAAYPYFVSSVAWDIAIGVAIISVYIFLKRVMRI